MDHRHVAAAASLLFFVLLACKGSDSTQSTTTTTASATATVSAPTTASAAPTATASAVATATASAAQGPSNAADVTHFPDEKKIDEKATLEWSSSKIRKKPQGDVLVSLPKGTSVTKVAERQGFFLLTFADPKDASKQLEGWVYKDAFTPEVAMESTPVGGKCPEGMKLTESAATGKVCSKTCTSSAQCKSGFVCYSGTCISAQGE
jgi:hypothetical protein